MNSKKLDRRFDIIRTLVSIGIALSIAVAIVFLVSKEPLSALSHFVTGPLQSIRRAANVMELAIPLTFCGLAVSVMFAANQSNLSTEGAFYFSCAATTVTAIALPLPPVIHPIVCLTAGTFAGVLVTCIPALIKVKWGASELVASLMINYICLYVSTFMIRNVVLDTQLGITASKVFLSTAKLPGIMKGTRLHLGALFAVLTVILIYFIMYRTITGFEVRIVGRNEKFASYVGIHVRKAILLAQMLGGALAGFAGATEMLGMYTRFQYQGLTQYGFDGMLIAIIARNNPLIVPVAAIFLAYIRTGADIMNRNSDVPLEIISVIQAIIIMLVVAQMFLSKYKHRMIVRYSQRTLAQEAIGHADNI